MVIVISGHTSALTPTYTVKPILGVAWRTGTYVGIFRVVTYLFGPTDGEVHLAFVDVPVAVDPCLSSLA